MSVYGVRHKKGREGEEEEGVCPQKTLGGGRWPSGGACAWWWRLEASIISTTFAEVAHLRALEEPAGLNPIQGGDDGASGGLSEDVEVERGNPSSPGGWRTEWLQVRMRDRIAEEARTAVVEQRAGEVSRWGGKGSG